jgi:hypothetical protein
MVDSLPLVEHSKHDKFEGLNPGAACNGKNSGKREKLDTVFIPRKSFKLVSYLQVPLSALLRQVPTELKS